MRPIFDSICNFFLKLGSYNRRFWHTKHRKRHRPNCVADLIFYDNFRSFNFSEWRIGQPWGEFHPQGLHQYYARWEDGLILTGDNGLELHQQYRPKQFVHNGNSITIPHGVGLVVSHQSFGYGYFECDATLPQGVGLWPAIWLSDHLTWPPEIDILEAYSNASGTYKSKLESNIHYGVDGVNKGSSGAMEHPLACVKESHRYAVLWTPKKIAFYYDGHLVRVVTSNKVLKWFNKPNVRMLWILNNAVRPEFFEQKGSSVFKIHNVKVFSLR